jgi:hypothetical protein
MASNLIRRPEVLEAAVRADDSPPRFFVLMADIDDDPPRYLLDGRAIDESVWRHLVASARPVDTVLRIEYVEHWREVA